MRKNIIKLLTVASCMIVIIPLTGCSLDGLFQDVNSVATATTPVIAKPATTTVASTPTTSPISNTATVAPATASKVVDTATTTTTTVSTATSTVTANTTPVASATTTNLSPSDIILKEENETKDMFDENGKTIKIKAETPAATITETNHYWRASYKSVYVATVTENIISTELTMETHYNNWDNPSEDCTNEYKNDVANGCSYSWSDWTKGYGNTKYPNGINHFVTSVVPVLSKVPKTIVIMPACYKNVIDYWYYVPYSDYQMEKHGTAPWLNK